jgi:hypothetical protein
MKKKTESEKTEDGLVKREVFNGEIWALFQSIGSLLQLPLSGKKYYRIKSMITDWGKDFEAINDTRQSLFIKYSAKDEAGKPIEVNGIIKPAPENVIEFNKEINELMSIKKELSYYAIDIPPESEVVWANIEPFLSEDCLKSIKNRGKE